MDRGVRKGREPGDWVDLVPEPAAAHRMMPRLDEYREGSKEGGDKRKEARVLTPAERRERPTDRPLFPGRKRLEECIDLFGPRTHCAVRYGKSDFPTSRYF